jgi:hypothetical protein
MHDNGRRTGRHVLGAAIMIGAALIGVATPGSAKSKPANECLVRFRDVPVANIDGGVLTCADCDPTCDTDGVNTPNNACTFKLTICANAHDPTGTCQPANLKKVKVKSKCSGSAVTLTPSGTNSVCGAFTGTVHQKKKGKNKFKTGKCKITAMALANGKPKRLDTDMLTLECAVQTAATCPTTSTTTVTTTTTTTTAPPVCGDGTITPPEVCDPPCTTNGQCTGNQVCNSTCSGCITPAACGAACGAVTPTRLRSVNTAPMVGSGTCGTSDGVVTGMVLDASGANVCNLRSGGLYFGGSGDAVPLPAAVPDLGILTTKVACCTGPSGATMEIVAAKDTDVTDPHPNRVCSARGVNNPEYPKACYQGTAAGTPCSADADCAGGGTCFSHDGCLFGAPLAIPNTVAAALSTCVINRVVNNAGGESNCSDGSSSLNLPLVSDLYLTGDYLDGSAPNRPSVPGIQPCPICSKVCAGGANAGQPCTTDPDCPSSTCGASTQCVGGPNHTMACTPGSTALTPSYPTSHDCPPPPVNFIGPLDIPFALTTGTTSKMSADLPGQQRVFCGFCGGGVAFLKPPKPCMIDADCAGLVGCGSATGSCGTCKQRQPGAFTVGDARTITETGSPAGPLTDQLPHPATQVSVFCIPPSYNGAVDGTADLPGPGAVALPGTAQLVP